MKVGDWVVCTTNDPEHDAACKRGDFGKILYINKTDVCANWWPSMCRQIIGIKDCERFSMRRVISELRKREK